MKKYDSNIKFIYEKPKFLTFLIATYILIISITIVVAFTRNCYSKISLKGIYDNNTVVIPTTIESVSNVSKSNKLKIDSKYYKFKILNYSEIYNNGNINIQDITIKTNIKNKMNNQIIDITFYYNKEPMYKKILRGVFK